MLKGSEFLAVAEQVIEQAIQLASDQGEMLTGAYVALADRHSGPPLSLDLVGTGPSDKVQKWFDGAFHHTMLLIANPHVTTTYELRKSQCWYAGAVAFDQADRIVCIFGPHEFRSEAAAIVIGVRLGWVSEEEVLATYSPERNPYLRPLLEACHWTE